MMYDLTAHLLGDPGTSPRRPPRPDEMRRGPETRVACIAGRASLRQEAMTMEPGETRPCINQKRANYLADYLRGKGRKARVWHMPDGRYFITRLA